MRCAGIACSIQTFCWYWSVGAFERDGALHDAIELNGGRPLGRPDSAHPPYTRAGKIESGRSRGAPVII